MWERVLRIAIAIGLLVDATVAVLALFFQPLLGPLLDVPTKDPALTTIYAILLRDLKKYRVLLWLIALDQAFAAILPAYEIARGHVVATWKTIGPIPFNAALAAIYVAGARSKL
jgi:hypothetical protein